MHDDDETSKHTASAPHSLTRTNEYSLEDEQQAQAQAIFNTFNSIAEILDGDMRAKLHAIAYDVTVLGSDMPLAAIRKRQKAKLSSADELVRDGDLVFMECAQFGADAKVVS